ncbi:MAG: hypothetical protein U9R08_03560 [Nanoarchaeota archaeon]|nr:hypothetical protein [Nanoarchaeota archaeon]
MVIKITIPKLVKILQDRNKDKSGTYKISKYTVKIIKDGVTINERVMNLYNIRKSQGLCVTCGTPVKKKNPKTGKKYTRCKNHRTWEN